MRDPLQVMVRFEVKEGEREMLVVLMKEYFATEVSTFPGFVSAKIHQNEEEKVLLNYAT